jgi:Ca-activated chloride channel family protein
MAAGGAMIDTPLAWRITRADAASDAAPLVERKSREINEALPPGRYSVSVEHGLVTRRFDIDVADAGPTVQRLALDAGILTIAASASRQGDQLAAPVMTIRTVADNDKVEAAPLWIGREATADLVVPAGKFAVDVTDGMARASTMLSVSPGASIRSDLVLETGRLELTAAGFTGGPLLDRVLFLISVDDADAPQGRREIARSTAPQASFTLQAGTYYVTARHGTSEVRERVAISSGDIVKRTLSLDVARLTVKPSLTGAAVPRALPIVTRIFEVDGSKRLVGQSTADAPVFILGAGRYRIDAQVGTLNIRTTRAITLAAGKDQTAALKLEAGEIQIAGLNMRQQAATVHAAIRDTKGRVVWRSRQGDTLKTIMAPGAYVLQIDSSEGRSERPISLAAGETRVIDLSAP